MSRFFLLFFLAASAAHAAGVALSADEASAYAVQHNPALAAARWRIAEARGRWQQSGRLSNPELELEYARLTRGQEGAFGVALTQRFPLSARLRHEKEVSRAELAAAEAEVRDGERRLVAEVRTLAVKIIASRGQRELRARQQENSRELSSFLLKRVEMGEAAAVDATQIDLETQLLEIEALQLTATEISLAGELRLLLGVAGDVALTGQLAPPSRGARRGRPGGGVPTCRRQNIAPRPRKPPPTSSARAGGRTWASARATPANARSTTRTPSKRTNSSI